MYASDLPSEPQKRFKAWRLAEAILKGGAADVVALVSTAEGKASIVVGVGEVAKGRADAVMLVRAAAAAVGGKGGGGRPDMAQAGGPDADKAEEALSAVKIALATAGMPFMFAAISGNPDLIREVEAVVFAALIGLVAGFIF